MRKGERRQFAARRWAAITAAVSAFVGVSASTSGPGRGGGGGAAFAFDRTFNIPLVGGLNPLAASLSPTVPNNISSALSADGNWVAIGSVFGSANSTAGGHGVSLIDNTNP